MDNFIRINCSLENAICVAATEVKRVLGKVYYDYEEGCLKPRINSGDFYFEVSEEYITTTVLNTESKAHEYLFTIKLMYISSDKVVKEWRVIYPDNLAEFFNDYDEDMYDFAICDLINSGLATCKE